MPKPGGHILHVGFLESFQQWIDFENYTVTVLLHRYRVDRLSPQTLGRFARVAIFDTADPSDMEGYQNAVDVIVEHADDLAREFGPPAAIVGLYEHTVYAAAVLRDHFHLPGTSAGTAVLFRDKVAMKQALLGSDVRVPRFWAVSPKTTASQVREIAAVLPGKAVLKPKGQAGSVGIQIFDSSAELTSYAETAGFAAGYEVEEFIDGAICHSDGVIRDGVVRFLSVSRYLSSCFDFEAHDVPLASVVLDDPAVVTQAAEFTALVLTRLGLRDSSFHLEMFLTSAGEFVFLEVASRFGGAGVSPMLRLVYGFDIVEESTLACLDQPSRWKRPGSVLDTAAVGGWLYMPIVEKAPSRVRRIHGLDSCPASVIFSETPNIAAQLHPGGFYATAGKFIVSGETTSAAQKDLQQIMDSYSVEVEALAGSA